MMTDPIADMLTRIRNAAAVRQTSVRLPLSKQKLAIAGVLKDAGYLTAVSADGRELVLELARRGDAAKLTGIHRLSKPGRRVYAPADRLPRVRAGLGTAVISTSQGLMTAKDARRRKLGGEVLLEVY